MPGTFRLKSRREREGFVLSWIVSRRAARPLETTIENCVTVSASTSIFLVGAAAPRRRVTERVALNIVSYRDEHGRFRSRMSPTPKSSRRTSAQPILSRTRA